MEVSEGFSASVSVAIIYQLYLHKGQKRIFGPNVLDDEFFEGDGSILVISVPSTWGQYLSRNKHSVNGY